VGVIDINGEEGIAFLQDGVKLKEQAFCQFNGQCVAGDGEDIAPYVQLDGLQFFKEFQIFIMFTEEADQVFGILKTNIFDRRRRRFLFHVFFNPVKRFLETGPLKTSYWFIMA
jgi:hypothetical protein